VLFLICPQRFSGFFALEKDQAGHKNPLKVLSFKGGYILADHDLMLLMGG
jgi:hypothetical protein